MKVRRCAPPAIVKEELFAAINDFRARTRIGTSLVSQA
jgi:hypothetical protein